MENSKILPFSGAKYYARSFLAPIGIDSLEKYEVARQDGRLQNFLPPSPDKYYSEWVSGSDFFIPYTPEETTAIRSESDREKPIRKKHVFTKPYNFNRKAWKRNPNNWHRGDWISYEECLHYVKMVLKPLGVDSFKKWRKHSINLPATIPSAPNKIYTNWPGWIDFLGAKRRATYLECKAYARSVLVPRGITSSKKWRKNLSQLPDNFPRVPNEVYREWEGWPAFFGINSKYNSAPAHKLSRLNYQGAKHYVLSFLVPAGITSLPKYHRAFNDGDIPDFLPPQPNNFYAGKGWISSNDFFGNKNKKFGSDPFVFLPYEEAKKWIHQHLVGSGINSCKKWERYLTNKIKVDDNGNAIPKLPANIPHAPYTIYKRSGEWKGWGDWFGTGFISTRKRKPTKP